jgi:hypothetical protein
MSMRLPLGRSRPLDRSRRRQFRIAASALALCLVAGVASSQRVLFGGGDGPASEFHLARMVYSTFGGGGSRGFGQPWWAIDYPYAEIHFLPALSRLTNLRVAEDSRHIQLGDDSLFQYPFLFVQQVGQGYWRPSEDEAAHLREYLTRGGFLMVDDFHGPRDWAVFEAAIGRVFPDRPIVDIPPSDPLLHVFFDLDERTQIPGERHLRMTRGGEVVAQMEGPPMWRGIYDDKQRLMVAINFNMDMGDAWEHADDPWYPNPMTALSYSFGVNYVIYAMTH